MSLGTPYALGGNSSAPNSGTTLTWTVTATTTAGDAIVVGAGTDGSGETVLSVADSKGNTYVQAVADSNQSDRGAAFVSLNSAKLTSGTDTITVTFSGGGGSHTAVARGCSGVASSGAVDVAISDDAATGTAPTSGSSGTLAAASEWAVAFCVNGNGGGSPASWTGGFTAQATEHAANNEYLTVADQTVSSTAALSAGATITSTKWCMLLVTLKAAGSVESSLIGVKADTSGANTTTAAITAASVAADTLIAVALIPSNTVACTSVTDTKSNTYTQRGPGVAASNGMSAYVYAADNSTALTTSDTVTAHWSGTSSNKTLFVIRLPGTVTSASDDQNKPASGTGTSISLSTGALSTSNEEAIVAVAAAAGANSVGFASGWAQLGATQQNGTGFRAAVAAQDESTSGAVTAAATLGAAASWAAFLITFKFSGGSGGGGGGALTLADTSPLPAQTVGTPVSYQFQPSGGAGGPFTFGVTSGAVPAGEQLTPGSPGGASSAILHVMAAAGPSGAAGQNFSQWQAANSAIGPLTGSKLFYGGDLPSSWSSAASIPSGGTGTSPKQIAQAGGVPIVCWNGPSGITPSSAATITAFLNSIVADMPGAVVGFCWQQEPENPTSGFSSGSQYTAGFTSIARVIHGFGNPNFLTVHAATWGQYGPSGGRGYDGSFLPPAADTDVYGLDMYQHQAGGSLNGYTSWSSAGLSNNGFFQRFLALVKPLAASLGRYVALTEYGVDLNTGTAAARNARIQADYAYIQAAFNGGAASALPLWCWLYWWHNMAAANTDYQFTDAATESTWQGIAKSATSSGGASSGGLLYGTPTTPASPDTFTVQVKDSAGTTFSKSFSVTVSAPGGSLAVTTGSPLPGATANALYSTPLGASGGSGTGYTWAILSGSLPAGLAIDPDGSQTGAAGTIYGTPTAAGTSTFMVQVTDSASNTATATLSITVAATVTITTTTVPPGTLNTAYGPVTLAVVNGTSPFGWAVISGALPAGLILDPAAGTISGTPTQAGVFNFTVQVTDAAGFTDTQALVLTISQAAGGLPALGRGVFGGGLADYGFQFAGNAMDRAAAIEYSFWNVKTPSSGTQYTDLEDMSDTPISPALVTSDTNGFLPEFQAPAGVFEMYADASGAAGTGPRYRITANNLGDYLVTLWNAVAGLAG